MTQYAGNDAGFVTGQIDGRYFYGLRRTEQGELFFTKVDQMDPNAVVQVNEPVIQLIILMNLNKVLILPR